MLRTRPDICCRQRQRCFRFTLSAVLDIDMANETQPDVLVSRTFLIVDHEMNRPRVEDVTQLVRGSLGHRARNITFCENGARRHR